jgi:hypothetical protein
MHVALFSESLVVLNCGSFCDSFDLDFLFFDVDFEDFASVFFVRALGVKNWNFMKVWSLC